MISSLFILFSEILKVALVLTLFTAFFALAVFLIFFLVRKDLGL